MLEQASSGKTGASPPARVLKVSSATTTPLFIVRGLRDFGDGFVSILSPVYLGALGFSVAEIGLIATAALLGSALLTIVIGFAGGRRNLRQLLILAAGLMVLTGLGF